MGNVAETNIVYEDVQRQYGPGSDFFRASQALTGLTTGLASGNVAQGLSNAAAPYLANQVGSYFDGLVNQAKAKGESTDGIEAARALAHAATGAAIAYMSGNNAASGAVGAVSGELMTKFAAQSLYPDKTLDQLTVAERNQVIAVASLASGLVGGAAGGSFEGAAVSAAAGYNAAVNNDLMLNWSGYPALSKGLAKGVGGKLKDDVNGLWQMAKHPINTLKSIKDLLSSPSAVLALGKDEVNRQLNEINYLIASYSDFDANLTDYQAELLGIRTGRFVTGVVELAAGAGGAVKSVAQLTEKLAAKFAVKETVVVSAESYAASSLQGARLSMQLSAETLAGVRAPTKITNYSTHIIKQMEGRDGGVGVSASALNDAFSHPIKIEYVPSPYGPTFKYTGNNAVVVVNPEGNAVTAWATNSAGVKK